jgi:hypothetical protein
MNDKVYASLVKLCVDICKRNGKTKLLWLGDKAKTLAYEPKTGEMVLTVHRWFANKSCPGDWLYARLSDLATEVTKELGGAVTSTTTAPTASQAASAVPYKVRVKVDVLNIRKGAGTNYATNGAIRDKGVYTITEEASGKGATKWGKLKSGAGWISLDYTDKV